MFRQWVVTVKEILELLERYHNIVKSYELQQENRAVSSSLLQLPAGVPIPSCSFHCDQIRGRMGCCQSRHKTRAQKQAIIGLTKLRVVEKKPTANTNPSRFTDKES